MIRTDKIQDNLLGVVGFKNPTISGYNIVDSDNQKSSSGLYYGDSSSLVTIKNIKDCQEDSAISNSNFNLFLKSMQKAVVLDVCNKVIDGQSDFISSANLYPFEKSFKNTIDPTGKFVGFEISSKISNYILSIPFIELCFDTEKTFKIYLYNSNKPKTYVASKEVTTVAGESTIVALDWIISDDIQYKGGCFYIGYFEDDLDGAKAYKRDYENSIFNMSTHGYDIEPILLNYSEATVTVEEEEFTIRTIDVTSEIDSADTFGLNIGVNIYTDYTEMLLRNKSMLANAIQLQMHEKVLDLIKYSTRGNINERLSRENVDFELYGNSKLGIDGVVEKLSRSINQIKKALFYIPRVRRSTVLL